MHLHDHSSWIYLCTWNPNHFQLPLCRLLLVQFPLGKCGPGTSSHGFMSSVIIRTVPHKVATWLDSGLVAELLLPAARDNSLPAGKVWEFRHLFWKALSGCGELSMLTMFYNPHLGVCIYQSMGKNEEAKGSLQWEGKQDWMIIALCERLVLFAHDTQSENVSPNIPEWVFS